MNIFSLYTEPLREEQVYNDPKRKKIAKTSLKPIVPSVANYDSHAVFLNKRFLKSLILNDLDFMMKTKNFQRKYMSKLPKLLWTFEKDLNAGDFGLVFLNPDCGNYKNNYVTSEMAMNNFDKLAETSFDYHLKEKFLKLLRKAYMEAFIALPDFDVDGPKAERGLGNLLPTYVPFIGKKHHDDQHKAHNNDIPQGPPVNSSLPGQPVSNVKNQYLTGRFDVMPLNDHMARVNEKDEVVDENKDEPIHLENKELEKGLNIKNENSAKQNTRRVTFQDEHNPQLLTSNVLNKDEKVVIKPGSYQMLETNQYMPQGLLSQRDLNDQIIDPQTENIPLSRMVKVKDPKNNVFNQLEAANKQPGQLPPQHEVLPPIDKAGKAITKRQQEQELKKRESEIRKVLAKKNFLVEIQPGVWDRKATQVQDYMTMLRQVVYILLAYQGIIVREFVSSDGQFIIAVCYAHEDNLKKIAETMGLRKEVDLSVVDLLSLEPVDSKLRPLRMNVALWDYNRWESIYGKSAHSEKLYYDINRLIGKFKKIFKPETKQDLGQDNEGVPLVTKEEGIEFHQLPRKCKGTLNKIDHMKEEYVNDIIDHDIVAFSVWVAYKNFLEILHQKIKRIDEKFADIKSALRKKYINVRVEAKNDLRIEDQLKLSNIDKKLLASKGVSRQVLPSTVLDNKTDADIIDKRSFYKVINRYISGNRSTYRLKLYKLSKQLGEAYAVS